MIKLIDILLEKDYTPKKSLKKTFSTYSCYFIVKFKKEVNRTQALERIRGIKDVTIVDVSTDASLEKFNKKSDKYDFEMMEIKFVTNKKPDDAIEKIVEAMVHSDDAEDVKFIPGIVAAKPKLDTLTKL